jgi:hypothetical protein
MPPEPTYEWELLVHFIGGRSCTKRFTGTNKEMEAALKFLLTEGVRQACQEENKWLHTPTTAITTIEITQIG